MITIKIKTDNAAFEETTTPYHEVARILRTLADKMERDEGAPSFLYDLNGNKCGVVEESA